MDLPPVAFYLYLLMVVTLYASPFVVIALVMGWRRGKLGQTLSGVVVILPLLALIGQAGFYLDLQLVSVDLESEQVFIDRTFPEGVSLYHGRTVGIENQNGFLYTRYQFDVQTFSPESLEILMPPTNVTSVASVTLAPPRRDLDGPASIQLVIRNEADYYNPINKTPREYFGQYYPKIAGSVSDGTVIILTLKAGDRSHVNQFENIDGRASWRQQMARVEIR